MPTVGTVGGYTPYTPGLNYPPGPVAWPAGQSWPINGDSQLNGQDLNEQLSLPVSFLGVKPFFQGAQWQSGGQTIPTSTVTPITLDTELSDPWGFHGNIQDNTQVIIPVDCDGVYLVTGAVPMSVNSQHRYRAGMNYNGATYSQGEQKGHASTSAGVETASYLDLIPCLAGDALQLWAWQDSGIGVQTQANAPSNYNSAFYSWMSVRWVAAATGVNGLTAPNVTSLFQNPIASSDFNNYITNSVNFLSYVPVCRAVQTTGSSVASGVNTVLTGITSTIDNYAAWNATTNTWTCPLSGIYLISGQVGFPSEASAYTVNPLLYVTSGGSSNYWGRARTNVIQPVVATTRRLRLNAGDTIQLAANQNFGSALTSGTGQPGDCRFIAVWQSR